MKLYPAIVIDLYNIWPLKVMNVPQYNTGRGALITLKAGAEIVVPDEEALYVYAKKADGEVVYNTVNLVGNQLKVEFSEQMTAVPGVLQIELQMVDSSGDSITTPIFGVNVYKSNIDAVKITSQSEFGALIDALADVEEIKSTVQKGDPGDAATIQVGTVTATVPGGNPVVTNSGTEQDAVLDFTLPRGEPGSMWYQGSAITGTNTSGTVFTGSGIANAELNDMYLNIGSGTDKGNVYVCVLAGDANTAKWEYKQNIMGPTGPAGTANASSVAYNNESSGLTAGNVQAALDELKEKDDELTNKLFYRINYASNVDVIDFIKSQINSGIYAGYVVFTNSTQLPEGHSSGAISFESPLGTEIVYLEFKLGNTRYYGYFGMTQNTITWKPYNLSLKRKVSLYNVEVTTQYAGTIGYIGSINLSSQSDFPGLDKLIAAIPIGACSTYDSNRVAIVGNPNGSKTTFVLNAPYSGTYSLNIIYLYEL